MENVVREQIVHPDDIHKNQMLYQHRSGDEKHNEKSTQLCRPVDMFGAASGWHPFAASQGWGDGQGAAGRAAKAVQQKVRQEKLVPSARGG